MHTVRRTLGVILAGLLLGGATRLMAQSTTQPAPPAPQAAPATKPASIDQLTADLASEDWKTRQQAADALAEVEPSNLAKLKQLLETTTDPDVRTAITSAVRRIEESSASGPTLLTLEFKDAPAADVLHAIARQVSYPIVTDNDEWLKGTRLTIDARNQPFWSVLKDLSGQWPARPVQGTTDSTRILLSSTGQNYLSKRSGVAGPFLICPVTINGSTQLDLLADKPQARFRSLNLQMTVLTEPKVRASRVSITVKTAVDENGKSLLAGEAMGQFQPMAMGTAAQTTNIPLRVQGNAAEIGKTIAKLSGSVRARVPSRTRRVEVANALRVVNKDVELSGRTVKVTLRQNDEVYELKLVTPNRGGVMDETTTSVYRDLALVDDQDQPLNRRTFNQNMVQPNNWEYTLTFSRDGTAFGRPNRKTGEPAKLIWELPVEPKDMEVAFELTDIPMVSQ